MLFRPPCPRHRNHCGFRTFSWHTLPDLPQTLGVPTETPTGPPIVSRTCLVACSSVATPGGSSDVLQVRRGACVRAGARQGDPDPRGRRIGVRCVHQRRPYRRREKERRCRRRRRESKDGTGARVSVLAEAAGGRCVRMAVCAFLCEHHRGTGAGSAGEEGMVGERATKEMLETQQTGTVYGRM